MKYNISNNVMAVCNFVLKITNFWKQRYAGLVRSLIEHNEANKIFQLSQLIV